MWRKEITDDRKSKGEDKEEFLKMEVFPLKEQERAEKGLKIAQAFPLPLDLQSVNRMLGEIGELLYCSLSSNYQGLQWEQRAGGDGLIPLICGSSHWNFLLL